MEEKDKMLKIKATNQALVQIGVWLKIIKEGTTRISLSEKRQIEKEFGELLIYLGYSNDKVCKIGDLSKDNETLVCYFEQTKSVASIALLIETQDDFAELKHWTPTSFSRYECHSKNGKLEKIFLTNKIEENKVVEARIGAFEEYYQFSLQSTKGESDIISLSKSKQKLDENHKCFDLLEAEKVLLATTFPINIDELYKSLSRAIDATKLDCLHITLMHSNMNEEKNKIEIKDGVLQTFIKDGHCLININSARKKLLEEKV